MEVHSRTSQGTAQCRPGGQAGALTRRWKNSRETPPSSSPSSTTSLEMNFTRRGFLRSLGGRYDSCGRAVVMAGAQAAVPDGMQQHGTLWSRVVVMEGAQAAVPDGMQQHGRLWN